MRLLMIFGLMEDGSSTLWLPTHQICLLTGENAGRSQTLSALDALAQVTNAQSTAIMFFSGHGYWITSPTGEFCYLIPYGYNLNRLHETVISAASLLTACVPFLLGSCWYYSTAAMGWVGEAKSSGLGLTKSPLPPEAQRLLPEGLGRVLVSSSQEDELSFAGRLYSAFIPALI